MHFESLTPDRGELRLVRVSKGYLHLIMTSLLRFSKIMPGFCEIAAA